MPVLDPTALIAQRCTAISDFHRKVGAETAELDVSGGIDSAVMLNLVVRSLGAEKVCAVYSSIDSSDTSRRHARAAARAAGVELMEVDLSSIYADMVQAAEVAFQIAYGDERTKKYRALSARDPSVRGSFRSCLRAPLGRFVNRMNGGGLRHGTGNEDEDRWLRFYQKGGDGEVDTNPIGMLSKGEVYQLAHALGVPGELIAATPTPDLWGIGDHHNDEEELLRLTGVHWSYSRVTADSGAYTQVGTIERINRSLDIEDPKTGGTLETSLFADQIDDSELERLAQLCAGIFSGFDGDTRRNLLKSARKVEASTRHKENPNCPTLGTRKELLSAGILSDNLPAINP